MKNKKIFFIYTVLILALSNCTKPGSLDYPKQSVLDEEFVSWFGAYKPGSWWIYYDSLYYGFDTIRVTKYERSNEHTMVWAYGKNGKNIRYDYRTEESDSGVIHMFTYYEGYNGIYFGHTSVSMHNRKWYLLNDPSINLFDSITVGSNNFTNIIAIDDYYFAKGIGLIQRYDTAWDGRVMENNQLIDYQINY